MLDDAGLPDVQVFVSVGLDEFEIDRLLAEGAPIDGFGVGTRAGVSAAALWIDCAYKLGEYDGQPTMKLSSHKESLPGPKQVYRFCSDDGRYDHDVITTAGEAAPGEGESTLVEVMNSGRPADRLPTPEEARLNFSKNFNDLPAEYKALRSPPKYPVSTSGELQQLQKTVAEESRHR